MPLTPAVTVTPPLRADSSSPSRSARPGWGAVSGAVAAQHAEHPAQLLEAGQRAGPDLGEALHQFLRRVRRLVGRGLGLDRDHRHVVGDDVVQLPGDALALLEQRALPLVPAFLDLEPFWLPRRVRTTTPASTGTAATRMAVVAGWPLDEGGADHGHDARGDHHPRLTADRDRVQAQDVDENPGREGAQTAVNAPPTQSRPARRPTRRSAAESCAPPGARRRPARSAGAPA